MSSKHFHLADHKKAYGFVLSALLVLTVITVTVAYQNYGIFNIVVAMGIATIKASLVILFFMHLKYDNMTNRVVFAAAFVFFAIFIGLTISDEKYRPSISPLKVEAVEPPAANQLAVMEKLRLFTPEQIEKGKTIFAAQCATCHGTAGKGDGPAAAALNPKPRDFTSGTWKQGGTPAQVFKTVSEGIAGTPMPPFSSMPVADRWALVHFIRSLSPNTPADTPETLALIGLKEGEGEAASPAPSQPELPVPFILERMGK